MPQWFGFAIFFPVVTLLYGGVITIFIPGLSAWYSHPRR